MPHFDLVHHMREGRTGGGVLLYVRQELQAHSVEHIKMSNDVESVWVDVTVGKGRNNSLRIGTFYRPPSQGHDIDEALCEEICRGTNERTVLLGDFNLTGMGSTYDMLTKAGRYFMDCFEENFLIQYVTKPTRDRKFWT